MIDTYVDVDCVTSIVDVAVVAPPSEIRGWASIIEIAIVKIPKTIATAKFTLSGWRHSDIPSLDGRLDVLS